MRSIGAGSMPLRSSMERWVGCDSVHWSIFVPVVVICAIYQLILPWKMWLLFYKRNSLHRLIYWTFPGKLLSCECHSALFVVNIGAVNGWVPSDNQPLPVNVDPDSCRHVATLGHNELTRIISYHINPNYISWYQCRQLCTISKITTLTSHTSQLHTKVTSNLFPVKDQLISIC